MSKQEAAFFYNDFSELFKDLHEAELRENVLATNTHEEILTCIETSSDL